MENIFVEFLPPWVETGLQPAFYDKESGTVLQQTARMYARVNMLIRMFNKLSKNTKEEVESFEGTVNDEIERFEGVVNDTVEEYIEKFNDLHDYVHDYFDNLDVQEEINNKLDAMAEAGTLEEIIASYLDSNVAWTFDTVDDMKSADNLINGSYARTIGYEDKTDNGGALYYIRTKTVDDKPDDSDIIEISDDLVAVLVKTDNFIPSDFNYVRYEGSASRRTDVWYAIIPAKYKPELTVANDTLNTVEEPSHNARRNRSSFVINAGVATGADYSIPIGVVISKGELIKDNSGNTNDHAVLLMKKDGTLKTLPGSSLTTDIQAEDPEWAVCGWWPIIEDGHDYSGDHDPADYKPRTFIGQNADGDYFIGVCSGRQYANPGLSAVDIKNFVESTGFVPTFLYSLDGGGSSVMVARGKRVNSLDNYENRDCATYINFKTNYTEDDNAFEVAYGSNIVDVQKSVNSKMGDQRGFLEIGPSAQTAGFTMTSTSRVNIKDDLVVVNLEFTTTAEINRYAVLLDKFPPATTTYLTAPVYNVESNTINYVYLQAGQLCVNASRALPAGKYHLNFTYQLKYNA